MSIGLADIFASVHLNLETGKFEADALKSATSVGGKMGDKLKLAVGGAIGSGVGAALGVALGGTVQFAAFEKRMNEVFTLLPDLSQTAMDEMTNDVKAFARETGNTTDKVVPALYQAISAGVAKENVFDFLRTANEAAVAGVASTEDSVNLLSAVTKAYGDTSQEAVEKVADLAFQTVKLGQTTFPDLARSIGAVTPLAAALGVTQEELFGITATLTGVTGNTSEVMTQQKAVMTALIKANPQMAEGLKKIGFETGTAAVASLGLTGTLDALEGTTGGNTQSMAEMLGSTEALTAVLALTGAQSEVAADKLGQMGEATGGVTVAFERMDSGAEATARKFAATMETMAIDLGGFASKFGPLPLIIAQTFGPSMVARISTGIGGLVGVLATALGGPAVTKVVAFAGGKAATVYLSALIAGDTVGAAMKSLWTRIAAVSLIPAGVAGTSTGITFGGAFAAAAAIAVPAAVVAALAAIPVLMFNVIPQLVSAKGGNETAAGKALGLSDPATQTMVSLGLGNLLAKAAQDAAKSGSAEAGGAEFMDRWSDGAKKTLTLFGDDWKDPLQFAGKAARDGFFSDTAEIGTRARWVVGEVEQAILDGKAGIVGAWRSALDERNSAANAKDQIIINNAQIAAAKKVLTDKKATAAEKAEARIRIRNLQASNQELLVEQSKYGTRAEQIAKTKALLTSKALLNGLKDKDPEVRQHWIDVKTQLTTQLGNLAGTGFVLGQGFTKGFIAGLVKDIDGVGASARTISRVVKQYLQVHSPSEKGPFSEMGGPEGWGSRWMALYTKGMGAGVGNVASMLTGIGGFTGPLVAGGFAAGSPAFTPAMATPNGSGFSPQITIYNPSPRAAEADIGRVLRRTAAMGMR